MGVKLHLSINWSLWLPIMIKINMKYLEYILNSDDDLLAHILHIWYDVWNLNVVLIAALSVLFRMVYFILWPNLKFEITLCIMIIVISYMLYQLLKLWSGLWLDGSLWIVDREWCRRKQQWPVLRYYPGISVQWLRKNMKSPHLGNRHIAFIIFF